MDNRAPSMLKSTLIGGALFGFLGGLPLVGALNCLCCSLVVAGGFLAAYLYSKECRDSGFGFRPGNGAVVGLVAGLFYSIVSSIVSAIARLITGTDTQQVVDQVVEGMEQSGAPPETIDTVVRVVELLTGSTGFIFLFFILLIVAAVFSTIGGLIGGAAFKVAPPPPAPPAQQPTPPPPSDAPTP